jgi:GNAT superfamily N-acetyltransferase
MSTYREFPECPTAVRRYLERLDADEAAHLARSAPASLAADLGVSVHALEGAVAVRAAKVDVPLLNRVIALGIDQPATEKAVDELIKGYRSAGVARFFVQLSPEAQPLHLHGWLRDRGLLHFNNWMKLYCEIGDPPTVESGFRIETVDAGQASAFASILVPAYGWPDVVIPWMAAWVGTPPTRYYMSFDGDRPVATAALYVDGDAAWLGAAATDAAYRGRGAQSGLIARRIADAKAAGCHWLITETAEDRPDRPARSFHNLVRFGFKIAYARGNYLGTSDRSQSN